MRDLRNGRAGHQIVIGNGQKLEFAKEARKLLRAIAKALRRLERSEGTAQEVVDEVNRIMADLGDVLSTGLRTAGPLRDEDDEDVADQERDDDERQDQSRLAPEAGAAPTPTPAPAAPGTTPTPTPTATVTPAPTATAEPTVTPEPTATATP